ncbi:MAG TPA: hypothetical protein PLU30_06100 [Verrucomicrobiae bacterium]|nr:hypothetical protein [Verrucomicrobiae bacterium]
MGAIVPSQRPKVSEARIAQILVERGVRDPVAVVGWPGWFADMGRPSNDRGIYDDAIIVAPKNDHRPGRWLLDCRVDVIMEAEAGNSPEALETAWGRCWGG